MTILYPARQTVKPARKPFSLCILRTAPVFHVDYTAADVQWWCEVSVRLAEARERAELDAEVERMAQEAEYHDMMAMGLSPF